MRPVRRDPASERLASLKALFVVAQQGDVEAILVLADGIEEMGEKPLAQALRRRAEDLRRWVMRGERKYSRQANWDRVEELLYQPRKLELKRLEQLKWNLEQTTYTIDRVLSSGRSVIDKKARGAATWDIEDYVTLVEKWAKKIRSRTPYDWVWTVGREPRREPTRDDSPYDREMADIKEKLRWIRTPSLGKTRFVTHDLLHVYWKLSHILDNVRGALRREHVVPIIYDIRVEGDGVVYRTSDRKKIEKEYQVWIARVNRLASQWGVRPRGVALLQNALIGPRSSASGSPWWGKEEGWEVIKETRGRGETV